MKHFSIKYWKGQRLLLLAFLLVHTVASFYYISHQNITYDEPGYIEYSKRWLHGKPDRIDPLDDSKSPVVAISWIPRIVRQIFNPNYQLTDYGRKDQKEGRYMMIFFSFLAAVYVYRWCNQLYGASAWHLPLLLLLFDPLYLSYSTIITTDLACGAMLLAVLYHFRLYLLGGSNKQFLFAALFTALAIITKQSLLFVLALLPLLFVLYRLLNASAQKINFVKSIQKAGIFFLIILIGINVAYYFKGTFTSFGSYDFESATLRNLQQNLSFLSSVPVPLPQPYIQSLDLLKAHAELGGGHEQSTFNGTYLFGTLKLSGGYWYYYLVVLFYKMPIGTMLLFIASIPLFIFHFRRKSFALKYMFLVVPILYYWIILSFLNQFQNGIRHLLIIYPLLFIGLGYLFQYVKTALVKWKIFTGFAIAYTFISVLMYYPYIIPYTNEFVADKETIYRKIYDSSIDYGQSDSALNKFVKNNPAYQMQSPVVAPGKYAVSMGDMLNTAKGNSSPYKWYMAFEPEGHYQYTILLFDISEEQIENADFKKVNYRIIP